MMLEGVAGSVRGLLGVRRPSRVGVLGLAAVCAVLCTATWPASAAAQTAYRMNSGGSDYVDANGDLFEADRTYVSGDFGFRQGRTAVYSGDVAGTNDDTLFLSVRGDRGLFGYSFDIPGGEYEVTLYFVEMLKTGPGQRVFDVDFGGLAMIDDLDIFARAGGQGIAHTESVIIDWVGGRFTVRFWPDVGPNAIVSAITVESTQAPDGPEIDVVPTAVDFGDVEVGDSADAVVTIENEGTETLTVTNLATGDAAFSVSAPEPPFDIGPGANQEITVIFSPLLEAAYSDALDISSNDADEGLVSVSLEGVGVAGPAGYEARINAGGGAYTDGNGHAFVADRAFVAGDFGYFGGTTASFPVDTRGTDDDPLYQTARGGASFSYSFDDLPSDTYEVRLYFNEGVKTADQERIFQVSIEGEVVLDELDVFLYAGSPASKNLTDVGTNKAYSETVMVDVTDGRLDIDFDVLVARKALVSAIAVRSMPELPLAGYTDVAADVGITTFNQLDPSECPPPIGTGSAWADFDNDEDLDLYLTNRGGANRLYRNDGDTDFDGLPNFTDVAATHGVDDPTSIGHSAVFIDYDNDGDQDLYVTSWGANVLFENQLVESGTPDFLDVTVVAGLVDGGRSITTAWADFDGDGDLDVFVPRHLTCMPPGPLILENEDHLFRNNGNGTFSDVTDFLCEGGAPCAVTSGLGFSAAWLDFDDDADLDLYLVNDDIQQAYSRNVLWRNDGSDGSGGWVFSEISSASEADLDVNGMGLAVGDWDNDGQLDLAFSNISPNNLLRNRGDGTFEDVASRAGVQRSLIRDSEDTEPPQQWTWGTAFFDHDNDGRLDLLYVAGNLAGDRPLMPNAFFGNHGDGTFLDLTATSGLGVEGRARNASVVDFDEDGFVDVLIASTPDVPGGIQSGGAYQLFHNDAADLGNTGNWLQVTVEGTVSNRDAIGTRLWVTTEDGLEQVREISSGSTHGSGDQRLAHFGLGENQSPVLTVRWPNGVIEEIGPVDPNQRIHLVEPNPALPNDRVRIEP